MKMDRVRTLIVDDEPLALDLVKGYVEQTPFLELVGTCSSAQEAYKRVGQGDVQLLFCDVQMPGMSGLTLMKALKVGDAPKVIFTTAFEEYALDGFKLDAVDYLLKPFDFDEFMKAAAKAHRFIELENQVSGVSTDNLTWNKDDNFFFVKSEYKLVRIDIPKIIYIEGLKDYIKIYLDGESKAVLTLNSLKEMEKILPENTFIRVHRSFIVNVGFVRGMERNLIIMPGEKVPMGESYKQRFVEIIDKKTI
jgi:DNA-binding LytR/AlgR family response regulator